MIRTANPALKTSTFADFRAGMKVDDQVMTVQGTVTKTAVLLILAFAGATFTWSLLANGSAAAGPLMMAGGLGGFVLALATIFKKTWAPVTAPLYAAAEGLLLGGLSAMVQAQFPQVPIVMQAVLLTFGVLAAMLILYTTRVIKVTQKFMMGVVAATGGIMLVYVVNFFMGFFGMSVPYLHSSGPIGIGISLAIVVVAALNLVLDFKIVEDGAEMRAPKWMEWYGAFGIMVTLVWLYIEMLRLLSKLNSRD